mgnify:FL=1
MKVTKNDLTSAGGGDRFRARWGRPIAAGDYPVTVEYANEADGDYPAKLVLRIDDQGKKTPEGSVRIDLALKPGSSLRWVLETWGPNPDTVGEGFDLELERYVGLEGVATIGHYTPRRGSNAGRERACVNGLRPVRVARARPSPRASATVEDDELPF